MNSHKPPFWAGIWYFPVTILSVGLLAWVPFIHAAGRLRRRLIVVLAAIYAVAAAAAMVLIMLTPTDASGQVTGGHVFAILADLLLLSLVVGGCAQQAWLRRQVYRVAADTDPALASALDARTRRGTARRLIVDDPLIARELRIGRPDLSRTYDDGGLVDLNNAPAAVIADICGLPSATAETIVAARTGAGGFLTVDDVFSIADIPVSAWEVIRDRGVVIRPDVVAGGPGGSVLFAPAGELPQRAE